MQNWVRRLLIATAGLTVVAAPLAGHASTPSTSTLSLSAPAHEWAGSAPWPNLLGCQPSDPTCDHHVLTVGNDVDPLQWSVAVDIAATDAHVAIYRIDENAPRVDLLTLGQTVVVNTRPDPTALTAIASSPTAGHLEFVAAPGTYDIEVAGAGNPAAPLVYRARARLCAATSCSA